MHVEQPRTPPERGEQGKWLPIPQTKDKALQILQRYDSGEHIQDLAQELGISHQAAYKALIKYCHDDWKDSQAARALAEYEQAKAKLRMIWDMPRADRDAVALACAREEVRTAQWELERLLRRLYGTDQPVSSGQVHINIGIARQQSDNTVTVDVQPLDSAQVLPPSQGDTKGE
jgi:hypothetical protein